MRSYLFYLLSAISFFTFASENFAFPFDYFPEKWSGDTALFVLIQDGEVIQLNAPKEEGSAFIFCESSVLEDAVWEVSIYFKFNPSSSNYLQLFLATDGQKEFNNGFYLVAGTAGDNISLWQRKNGKDYLLIEGTEDRLDNDPALAKIRVSRERGGWWKLETDTGDGWQKEGEVRSPFGFPAQYLGLGCHFTKTRCDKFFIGPLSVSGKAYKDTVPPEIDDMEIVNGHTLKFSFSEAVDSEGVSPVIEVLDHGVQNISEIKYLDENRTAILKLTDVLPTQDEGKMLVSGWCDANGACMKDTVIGFSYLAPEVTGLMAEDFHTLNLSFNQNIPEGVLQADNFTFSNTDLIVTSIVQTEQESVFQLILNKNLPDAKEIDCFIKNLVLPGGDTIPEGPYSAYYHEALPYDIVISEVMNDPSPAALLPEVEYIELFNRSDLPVNLRNMLLEVSDKKNELPEYLLFPGDYVVLVGDTVDFSNCLLLDKLPALTNGGGEIVLRSPSEMVITALRYPGTLEGQAFKQKGGWSMEVVDPDNLSGDDINWVFCQNDKGGTPGYKNSLNGPKPDLISPGISDSWLENDSILAFDFGEPLTLSSFNLEGFQNENPDLGINNIWADSVFADVLYVAFQNPLIPDRIEKLSFPAGITDLAGNAYSGQKEVLFGYPGRVDSFDVVINELLFDPPAGGCDYVELFNRSQHIISLDSICLARNSNDVNPEELICLSDRIKWLLPGEYLCFAEDIDWVRDFFNCKSPGNLREIAGLPNFLSEGGTVFLTKLNGAVIDWFDYSPELHFALLADTKGVALERTSTSKGTNDPTTWHSAASTVGYGTPTWENSQIIKENRQTVDDLFDLSPGIFTPNLDGVDDQLIISCSFEDPGKKGTFIVFDVEGHEVRILINNQSLGTSMQITWDGITDDYSLAPPGIYIIWAQIFDIEGHVHKQKKTCVLGTSKQQ
jgi:hypothetical protein